MKTNSRIILTALSLLAGAAFVTLTHASGARQPAKISPSKMNTMTIKWQRLVGNTGQTCDRCGATQQQVRKAYALLHRSLAPLGINVVLQEKTLDRATTSKSLAESNRIWVAGKPLETWLCAKTGASACASCGPLCGGSVECRTLVVGGSVYESIPSALIVKAGLLAAADIVGAETARPCCGRLPLSGVQTITDGTSGPGGCCGQ